MYEGRDYFDHGYGRTVYFTSAGERFYNKEKAEAREYEIKKIIFPILQQMNTHKRDFEFYFKIKGESELKIFYILSNILRGEFRTVWGRTGRKFKFPVEGTLNLDTKEVTVGGFDIDRCI